MYYIHSDPGDRFRNRYMTQANQAQSEWVPGLLLKGSGIVRTFGLESEWSVSKWIQPTGNRAEKQQILMTSFGSCTRFIDDSLANCQGAEAVGFNTINFKDPESCLQELGQLGVYF